MSTPLEQALGRLVADGTLTAEQARAVSREHAQQASAAGSGSVNRPGWKTVVAEIGGYVGGAFVVAAAVVLTGSHWSELGQSERIWLLGAPALLLLVAAAGLLARTPGGWPVRQRPGTGPRRRVAAVLVVVGGSLLAGAAAVAARGTGDGQEVWYFGVATAIGALGYAGLRASLLHVATAVAATLAALTAAQHIGFQLSDGSWDLLAEGLAMVAVAVLWLVLTTTGVLAERALGLTVAGVIAFVGGEILATSSDRSAWLGYLVVGLVAAGGLVGYAWSQHVGVGVVGVVALATVVPQTVLDYTDGALGAAGALLVTGLSILGASLLGLQLRGQTPRTHSTTGGAPTVTHD